MGQELLEVVNWEGRAVHDIVVDVNPEPGNHTSTQTKRHDFARQNSSWKNDEPAVKLIQAACHNKFNMCQTSWLEVKQNETSGCWIAM